MADIISFEGVYSVVINFAMQQNYVPVIKKLVIKNNGQEAISDIELKVSAQPEFIFEYKTTISAIEPGQSLDLGAIPLPLSAEFLYSLTEKITGVIRLEASTGGENTQVLGSSMQNIEVLAYDQWFGSSIMPELLSAFVTPNHNKITEIIMKAGVHLEKWTGSPSFYGYQSNNPNTVKREMAAVYAALQEEGIAYSNPPASYGMIGQRVRLCDDLFAQKMGTCLDLSLVYAGCLEAIGLYPMVILINSHAFIGCWLEEKCFPECVTDDCSAITKRFAMGINEICVVETTAFVAGSSTNFDNAVISGERNLNDPEEFQMAIDIHRSRGSGITPLPIRSFNNGVYSVEVKHKEQVITSKPKELQVFQKVTETDNIQVTKQQVWERKLLDLSLRNPLLSFRVTRTSIQLMCTDLAQFEDEISTGREFQILPKPADFETTIMDNKIFELANDKTIIQNLAETEFKNSRIRSYLTENELTSNVVNLYRKAKNSLEENGSNTLFLALGFLKWYESDVSEKARYAPIVLIPVDLVRKISQRGYVIRVRDEDPQMNITLLEMLRQFFGIQISGLDPLPMDEKGIDLAQVFHVIRSAVMTKQRWDIVDFSFVGLFSFSQFIMWNDIKNRAEDLKKNKIVSSLSKGKLEWNDPDSFVPAEQLDDKYSPFDVVVPISADASQLSAICAAGEGKSFILHGPPGTGKSQTITNIIANALWNGKSVLFIAEKMAALSVVQKRLEKIGLGNFCLELHSNKAKKKDVLNQLAAALETGKKAHRPEYEALGKRLSDLRANLNQYARSLHKKQSFGFSCYDAISHYEEFKDSPDCIRFTSQQIKSLNYEKITEYLDLISMIKTAAIQCGEISGHPLSDFNTTDYSQTKKGEISDTLNTYNENLIETNENVCGFEKWGIETKGKLFKTKLLKDLLNLTWGIDYLPKSLLLNDELRMLEPRVKELCQVGNSRDLARKELLERYNESVLDIDEAGLLSQWRTASQSWILAKILGQGKVLKQLRICAATPDKIIKENVEATLLKVGEYKEKQKIIEQQSGEFSVLFMSLWNGGYPDWNAVQTAYDKAVQIDKICGEFTDSFTEKKSLLSIVAQEIFSDVTQFKGNNIDLKQKLDISLEKVKASEEKLASLCGIDFNKVYKRCETTENLIITNNNWIENIEGMRDWCGWLSVKERAFTQGLSDQLLPLEKGEITARQFVGAFCRGMYLGCCEFAIDSEPSLKSFSGNMFEDTIQRFKDVDTEFQEITKQELVVKLSQNIPSVNGNAAASSETGILQRAIKSQGRMMSIRKLFDNIPTLLRRLCPCMLMSPISVAQYIDPAYPKFDLVVFDEASQLPTCSAVGAIARGENAVVVGDPKQLPPTSFFTATSSEEEDFELEDMESILDDCLALSMPQEHLLWHYRSRHESLIAFSNMQYYDNRLYTFPSANDLQSKVKLIQLEGFYDKGKTKQNAAEATAVVQEIIRRLKDEALRKQSIGVVTFSSVQQNLIDDMLVCELAKDTQLQEIADSQEEPIFIKNLENVQGDERDVILFSIGYGPDQKGNVSLNFGPINRDGGWRRLNVAVSRARQEMIVFSVLRPEQIDLSRTRSDGVAGLKGFLEFARQGRIGAENITAQKHETTPLNEIIASEIRKLGFEARTNIGSSGYRINIGIVDREETDRYIMAVACDGPSYMTAKTARDRNVSQLSVLSGLGWNIHRIWAMDWFENPQRELHKLKAAISEAYEKKHTSPADLSEENNENNAATKAVISSENEVLAGSALPLQEQATFEESFEYFEPVALTENKVTTDIFCSGTLENEIKAQMVEIVSKNAPVGKNYLFRQITDSWGINRMTARVEEYLKDVLSQISILETENNGYSYIWSTNLLPMNFTSFRLAKNSEERRSMEDISPHEIANGVRYILENQLGLLRSDLVRETYKLFGFTRSSAAIEAATQSAIDFAIRTGDIKQGQNGKITLA